MISKRLPAYSEPHTFAVDYYGKPEFWKRLVRWDNDTGQWSRKRVSGVPLGPSKSGKYTVYKLSFVLASLRHEDIITSLLQIVPPPDDFSLDYTRRHSWDRPRIKLPLQLAKPLILPEKEGVLIDATTTDTVRQLALEFE
ncbi:hypothetical protein D0962_28355 [Leptolyngbyaceae cyanobacterium CCMR0082]|uniref:Uncharacterized protein n=1 Tax=Adonisia turfae CCMR0082 TaxID=2304604 RepID=A0A6M0SDQ6_9CYAN|nr:hypothetical protein [Adonisia turfae]NEZ66625.1 hypothetical protein [Adonisia turfae CCMR0082]